MTNGFYKIPVARNERILGYAPKSSERKELQQKLQELRSQTVDIPMYIGENEVKTGHKVEIHPPHDIKHSLGFYHKGDASHVNAAIDSAMTAKKDWENMHWEQRASIFLKAAELIAGPYRQELNAVTMLGQSKNSYQAEIDSACEMIDFLRYNVQYMGEIYSQQPYSPEGIWNRLEQRPLEGFVFALTPFNFTAIAGNLPTSAAMMGNTVVWKCASTAVYAAHTLMKIFKKAGLPDGVINLIYVSGPVAADIIFKHPDFAGIHFTGSTNVFHSIWKTVGDNIHRFKAYPRIVGETGGKDYVFLHPSAHVRAAATAIIRGAFEYQGQKCSAASRAYIPRSIWKDLKKVLVDDMHKIKVGPVEDFTNFVNAVIDEKSFDKLVNAIEKIKNSKDAKIIFGGDYDKTKGFFINPTIALTEDPKFFSMEEELFGPILTIYVYEDNDIDKTLDLLDTTSIYALTGCIFAQDRYAIQKLMKRLTHTAGNFYVNDKPTGAVVGQQPFGGARGSGTNDKAGAMINLLRWVSPRTIKENFVPQKDYMHPNFLED